MKNDIVPRLRIRWDSMTDMGNAQRAEAADEIERLRKELEESERLLDEYQREDADRTRWEIGND